MSECKCVGCESCAGTGNRWEHNDIVGLCDDCGGSGLTEKCDFCEEFEDMERQKDETQ